MKTNGCIQPFCLHQTAMFFVLIFWLMIYVNKSLRVCNSPGLCSHIIPLVYLYIRQFVITQGEVSYERSHN